MNKLCQLLSYVSNMFFPLAVINLNRNSLRVLFILWLRCQVSRPIHFHCIILCSALMRWVWFWFVCTTPMTLKGRVCWLTSSVFSSLVSTPTFTSPMLVSDISVSEMTETMLLISETVSQSSLVLRRVPISTAQWSQCHWSQFYSCCHFFPVMEILFLLICQNPLGWLSHYTWFPQMSRESFTTWIFNTGKQGTIHSISTPMLMTVNLRPEERIFMTGSSWCSSGPAVNTKSGSSDSLSMGKNKKFILLKAHYAWLAGMSLFLKFFYALIILVFSIQNNSEL